METDKKTLEVYERAYGLWLDKYYKFQQADRQVEPFLIDSLKSPSLKSKSWLAEARKALFISASKAGEKLGVTRSAYSKLEKSEIQGTITLEALAKAAEVLDCELVYAIRPKKHLKFSRLVWQVLLSASRNHSFVLNCRRGMEAEAIVAIAALKMTEAPFRKNRGWSQRH